MESSVETT